MNSGPGRTRRRHIQPLIHWTQVTKWLPIKLQLKMAALIMPFRLGRWASNEEGGGVKIVLPVIL